MEYFPAITVKAVSGRLSMFVDDRIISTSNVATQKIYPKRIGRNSAQISKPHSHLPFILPPPRLAECLVGALPSVVCIYSNPAHSATEPPEVGHSEAALCECCSKETKRQYEVGVCGFDR
jgi:hypothetical protein